jgi:hypothetical protein
MTMVFVACGHRTTPCHAKGVTLEHAFRDFFIIFGGHKCSIV